jgi:tetratricopeptide (TPR) repeat protein
LEISRKIGNIRGDSVTLASIGLVYKYLGQYQKGLEYYEKSLEISRKIDDVNQAAVTIAHISELYQQIGQYDTALASAREALAIKEKIGVPTNDTKATIGNLYLDQGNIAAAETLIKQVDSASSMGRLYLMKSDYSGAGQYYEQLRTSSEESGNVDDLFTAYTGLGKAHEAMQGFKKAEEFYEKGMNLVEELRSGLLPSERKNFFEVKTHGFLRSDPAKGLVRVKMKLNRSAESIAPSELTRARTFAEHLSEASATGASKVPKRRLEEEQSLVNQLAALKKALAQTDRDKQSDKYNNISIEVKRISSELSDFVNTLWKDYPAYAAVKYPRPPSLKDSALRPEECAVIFDVSSEGVGVILIRDKAVSKAFYLDLKLSDLERDVFKFREPFEKLRLKDYDAELAKSLYNRLLRPALADVPKGAPLIIIPDGILAMLPFEALVTGGEATWNKSRNGFDYPDGLTFLGDEHPISYYQSVTALTLVRTIGNKEKPKDSLLVVADPVFNMKDQRAQQAGDTRLSQKEKEYNIQRMTTIEDSDGPLFPQLPETGKLAESLSKMYGTSCLSVTGLKADKLDFCM